MPTLQCPLCGTGGGHSSARVLDATHRFASAPPILDDLAAARWVQAYDAAWLGQNWDSLADLLAPEVEFVVPALADVLIGRPAIVESLRAALERMVIHEYNATDLTGSDRASVGIVTYRWQLDCSVGQQRLQTTGRDVLVLKATDGRWLLAWRGQFSLGA